MMESIKTFKEALLDLDKIKASQILEDQQAAGAQPLDIVSRIVVPALEEIGAAWQDGNLALSQIYMSGRICEQLIDQVLPPSSPQRMNQPRIGIAVLNDYHLLGKRIVHAHIRSAGFEIKDYGRRTVDELTASIVEDKLDVILISTLMYPSALSVKDLKGKLQEAAPEVKVLVGGAPFNMDRTLWRTVGADAMGLDGGEALAYINNLMEGVA